MKRTIFVGLLSFLLLGWCAPTEAQSLPDKKDKKEQRDSLREAKKMAKMTPEERERYLEEKNRVMPTFQGGDLLDFRKWFQERLSQVSYIKKIGPGARVVICFVVEKDGSLSLHEVVESNDSHLLGAVLQTLSESPRWEPGRNGSGELVRVGYMFPIETRSSNSEAAPTYENSHKPNTKGQTPSTLHQPHASYGY